MNRFLWFYHANGFIEIGFVRRICADFAHRTDLIPVQLRFVWEKVRQIGTISEASNATSTSAARKQGPISERLTTQARSGQGAASHETVPFRDSHSTTNPWRPIRDRIARAAHRSDSVAAPCSVAVGWAGHVDRPANRFRVASIGAIRAIRAIRAIHFTCPDCRRGCDLCGLAATRARITRTFPTSRSIPRIDHFSPTCWCRYRQSCR